MPVRDAVGRTFRVHRRASHPAEQSISYLESAFQIVLQSGLRYEQHAPIMLCRSGIEEPHGMLHSHRCCTFPAGRHLYLRHTEKHAMLQAPRATCMSTLMTTALFEHELICYNLQQKLATAS